MRERRPRLRQGEGGDLLPRSRNSRVWVSTSFHNRLRPYIFGPSQQTLHSIVWGWYKMVPLNDPFPCCGLAQDVWYNSCVIVAKWKTHGERQVSILMEVAELARLIDKTTAMLNPTQNRNQFKCRGKEG